MQGQANRKSNSDGVSAVLNLIFLLQTSFVMLRKSFHVGHYRKHIKSHCATADAIERYQKETKRLLSILESRLMGRDWLVGDHYSLAE
jgi:glutathione S-transferase